MALDRRAFLAMVGRGGVTAALLSTLPRWARAAVTPPAELLVRNAWPEHYETTVEALAHSWITRTDRFFVRSHFPAPDVDPKTWQLEIAGQVSSPLTLRLADLQAMTQHEETYTLECAGNGRGLYKLPSTSGTQWARGAVGNATWGGVRLQELLFRAGIQPDAKYVWFEAADAAPLPTTPRFVRSLPIEKAMNDVLLAHSMNGAPLLRLHGAPLRAIVPGWYGVASTKWLTKIRLEKEPSDNQFQAKGYHYIYPGEDPATAAPVEELRVKSLITQPIDGSRVRAGKVTVQGFAWAGPAGVRLVEISTDGGKTWSPAGFMGENQTMAWRQWATQISAKAGSTIKVMARATDTRGEAQPIEARANASGYGNNSIQVVSFRVA
jgi:DMSO/TMAO reductase YedYZ molybdopterin-dependent catalytic subunit